MKLYITENHEINDKPVLLDDMILTKDMPTTAGSKMLDGYMSLFNAEVVEKLLAEGYSISGKSNVGEFGIDLMGETSYFGEVSQEGILKNSCAEIIRSGKVKAALCLDVNGAPRRGAALGKMIFLKPTYGSVSRYGTIPVACSGETIGVMAEKVSDVKEMLNVIVGHDDKDGTSLGKEECAKILSEENTGIKKIAVIGSITDCAEDDVISNIGRCKAIFEKNGITVEKIDGDILKMAKEAWNVLMCSELCNNVSRYDGIKYGYRTPEYTTIDELYTNSRTEAFGLLLKAAILYGSNALSTNNYKTMYDRSLRIRRLVVEYFNDIFKEYDAVMMPAAGKKEYTSEDCKNDPWIAFDQALYTAPASISGMPAIVTGGVQFISAAFNESILLSIASKIEKEAL